ncbi:class I SAM-dependent methyltransferase [Desulfospira joergensenii]|uniref:class I SAM-dependent methyltransferase n=1 Tax=Desulfospira joergensenii TaxID=53329 RepID=UPI0003B323B4|nr:class I SAM-dependent methyltransferase [Desulfospira joergensenii]
MDNSHKKPKGAGKSSFELIDSHKLKTLLPVKPGSAVIDLACGKGLYSLFLSEIVGEAGLIYAVDLWEEGLVLLDEQIRQRGISNILPMQADASRHIDIDDFSADLCLMATVLHDFEEAGTADAVLEKVKNLLKPGGCLGVIEFKKIEGPPGPPIQIRLGQDEVEAMASRQGFVRDQSADIGEYNYLMTFISG